MKNFLIGVLVIAAMQVSYGQITWEKKTGPYGGSIADIVVHSSGTVYALGDNPNQSIWRSTDNGNTWVEHTPSAMFADLHRISDLKLAPDGSIYALASANIYKTTDNGTTWTKLNTAAGSNFGGFDQGEEIGINVLSGTLYVNGYHYPDSKQTIYRSTNGGVTWTKGYQGQYFSKIVSNTLGDVYAITNGSQIWKSTDDGVTFAQLTSPVPADVISQAKDLVAKPNGSELAVVTNTSDIYTLTGPSFTSWTGPVSETNITNPTTYGSGPAKLVYATDNATLFLLDQNNNKVYSRNGGTWTARSTAFLNANGEDVECITTVDATNLYVGSQRLGVYKSINSGLGWTEVNNGIENLDLRRVAVADNGAVIVSGTLTYRSTDDGQSWSKVNTACCGYYTVMKATSGTPKTLLLLAEGGGVSYKSTDNGANWTTIANTPGAYNFNSPDGTKLLASNSNQLYYSGDQGATWSSAITVSGGGFPASNFSYTAYGDQTIAMDQNGVVYAFVYNYTTFSRKFFKIVLNGLPNPTTATATEISFATMGMADYVSGVKYLNNKIYVFGDAISGNQSVITSTANAGTSWTAKSVPQSFQFDVDPINNYLFVTKSNGSSYTIYISRDDATSFSSSTVNTQSGNTHPYGIALNSSGIAFLGMQGSSVHKTTGTIVTPPAPTGLVSVGASATRITLQWNDNATNEDNYVIEKFNGTDYDSLTRTYDFYQPAGKGFVEIQGLTPNTSYQFRVFARNDAGDSQPITLTTSTLQTCVSDIPDNKSWSGNVNGTTALTNVVVKQTSPGVYSVSDVNNGTYTGTTVVAATFEYACNGANPQTYLEYKYPFYANGNGSWTSGTNTLVLKWITEPGISPTVTGTVTLVKNSVDPAPAAPTAIGAYSYSDNSIEVKWKGVAFEKKFLIERKTGAGGTYAQVGSVDYPGTSFIDNTGLTLNTTYFYRVRSENANAIPDQSPYSSEMQLQFKKPNFVVAQTAINSTPINTIGAIWADFNNDGLDDLMMTEFDFFSGTTSQPLIFQNSGGGNFAQAVTNFDVESYANGTAADYDNDGDIDIFYSTFGAANKLYNGNGTFSFTKVTPSDVEEHPGADIDDGTPFSASWVDYNNDGLLDLFVALNGEFPSALFKQNPDHTFSKQSSAGDLTSTVIGAFGSAWADYDNDGDKDVFIIDQTNLQPNKLFRNNGDGTFTRVSGLVFDTEIGLDPQSCSWADFDNDQDMDLFVGGESGLNFLYRNNGNGTFTKLTTAAFTVTTTGSIGSAWLDVNNDGFLDLLSVGGGGATTLFVNSNGTSFTAVTTEKISDASKFVLSAATSDFNNDGFVDVLLGAAALGNNGQVGTAENALLMKNNNTSGNWIKIKLIGTASNRSAIGAKIKITTGAVNQIREIGAHIGIASQHSLTQHFGIGSATKVDNLVVTWPSGLTQTLTNVTANTTVTITEDSSGPAITSRTPDVSSTNIAANTTISFTLNETSTAQAGKMLLLYLHSDLSTPILGLDVTSANNSGNTYTFTLASNLLAGTQYNISVDAGAFKDVYGNASLEFPTGNWTFTIAPAPVKTAVSPTHAATNVAANAPLQITFDKNVTAVAGKHLKVMDGSTAIVDIDVSTAGTVTNNVYAFTPLSAFPNDKVLKVVVDAGAFIDATKATLFAGIPLDSWNFRTVATPDVIGPVITFTAPATAAKGFGTTSPVITVTDDRGVVSSVEVKIKKIGSPLSSAVTVVATQGTGADVNKWTFAISEAAHFDAMGTEYFITAKDDSNNATTSPASGTYKLFLTYSADDSQIPQAHLGFGGTVSNWKAFSVPFEMGVDGTVTGIFDELKDLTNKVDYKVLTIKGADQDDWSEYPEDFVNIDRGHGYFINIKSAVIIKLGQGLQAPPNSRDNLFKMTLVKGWNMIGNPYLTQISWDDVATLNNLSGDVADIRKFNGSTIPIGGAQTIDPYEGAFVFSDAQRDVFIPFFGQTTSGGRKGYRTLGDDINASEWLVNLELKQGEEATNIGSFGMAPDANMSYDIYDGAASPRFINYLDMSVAHPESFAKNFSRDVVPTQGEYTWSFNVGSNIEGNVEITWDNTNFASGAKELYLLDVSRQHLVDMRTLSHYSFNPKESGKFKLYFGEHLKITPENVLLGKAFPNPTSGYTSVAFSLPDSGGPEQMVSLDIVDNLGRKAGTVTQGRFNPGYYDASFDARELPSGVYMYRLTVQGKNGQTTHVKKLIIK